MVVMEGTEFKGGRDYVLMERLFEEGGMKEALLARSSQVLLC